MALRPPSLAAPRRLAVRAVVAVARNVGTLLLLCAAVLLFVGLGVQLSRQRQLADTEQQRSAPQFDDTLGERGNGASTEASPTAPSPLRPPGTPGAKHIASRGPSVSLGSRVVVFGGGLGEAAASPPPLRRFGQGPTTRRPSATPSPTAARAMAAAPTPAPALRAVPERIIIQAIGVDRPVVPIGWTTEAVDNALLRSVWRTADDAVGWHETSAPLGQAGNTVVSGHNNIAGAVFKQLHELAEGDMVTLKAGAAEIRYAVERTFIVREDGATDEERRANNRWIEPTDDERLTLVTCYPPWGNTHRLIVIARPVVYVLP